MKSAIQLIQRGAKFVRFTSGDENNRFMGSYWEMPDGKVERSGDRFNHEVATEIVKAASQTGKVSDGYHTFDELYDHRMALFVALCNQMPDNCIKTKKNFEKQEWKGWFLLVMNHPFLGQLSYHLKNELWDNCRVRETEYNEFYDGHNSNDVLERLLKL